jgi:large subunit ribosomal protein L15
MQLHSLPPIITRKAKRLGRGYGSGKGGHTATRGQKGQKSRTSIKWWFEGGQLPFVRRFPFWRGKRRFQSLKPPVQLIKLEQLNAFKANTKVTPEKINKTIFKSRFASKTVYKILKQGKLTKKLTFSPEIKFSQSAKNAISKLS